MVKPLSPDQCREAIRLWKKHGENITAAAKEAGLPRTTMKEHIAKAQARGFDAPDPIPVIEAEGDLPSYEDVRSRLTSYNQKHIEGVNDSRNIYFDVPHKPFLIFFIGDPHMDSPGFDDRLFAAHMEIIRKAQKEFPTFTVNMGDILDHWPTGGRLGAKHHDAHITRKEALALVRGFLQAEGIDFACHILGNHDIWPGVDFATLMRQWTDAPIADWATYLHFRTSKGFEFPVFTAHDMPGHSMYNKLHALMRRAREDGTAQLHVAAHKHISGKGSDDNGHRGKVYWHMRVGGYKRADEYAWRLGLPEMVEGASGLAVINPDATMQDSRCHTFYDLQLGLEWAQFLRGRK